MPSRSERKSRPGVLVKLLDSIRDHCRICRKERARHAEVRVGMIPPDAVDFVVDCGVVRVLDALDAQRVPGEVVGVLVLEVVAYCGRVVVAGC